MQSSTPKGVRLDKAFLIQRTGEGPLIEAIFLRDPYASGNTEVFGPLRPPDRVQFRLRDIDPALLDNLSATIDADLTHGKHQFPLFSSGTFTVEVEPETRAAIIVDVAPADGQKGTVGPVVKGMDVEFTRPLRLTNIIESLLKVQELFEDRTISTILDLLAGPASRLARRVWTSASKTGGLMGVIESAIAENLALVPSGSGSLVKELDTWRRQRFPSGVPEPASILLSRMCARPRWDTGTCQWELDIAFSGHVEFLDAVNRPFWDVILPSAILPKTHAALVKLLSREPLATGAFKPDGIRVRNFIDAIAMIFDGVSGSFSGVFDAPVLGIRTRLTDRTGIRSRITLPPQMKTSGRFTVTRNQRNFLFNLSNMHLSHPRGGNATISAEVNGSWDMITPNIGAAERLCANGHLTVHPKSTLPDLSAVLATHHPLAEGLFNLRTNLIKPKLTGSIAFDKTGMGISISLRDTVEVDAEVDIAQQEVVRSAWGRILASQKGGGFRLTLKSTGPGRVDSELSVLGRPKLEIASRFLPIPELDIQDGTIHATVDSTLSMELGMDFSQPTQGQSLSIKPRGSLSVISNEAFVTLDGRKLEFPVGTKLSGRWRRGAISSRGVKDLALDVSWDLHSRPCLLSGPNHCASILTDALRQGTMTVHMSPGGRFTLTGDKDGPYGVNFFNALLNPASEAPELLTLLDSDDALSHVVAALGAFNPEMAGKVEASRNWLLKVKNQIEVMGISQPGDIIPRDVIARLMSRILVENESLAPRFAPIIKAITLGQGFDIRAAQNIIMDALPNFDATYEIDGVLRWLKVVLEPGDKHELPHLIDLEPHAELDSGDTNWPSADDLISWVTLGDTSRIADVDRIAPWLTIAQIDAILARYPAGWGPDLHRRLQHVRMVKGAVTRIEEGWGGLAFVAQSATIAGFLGTAVGPLCGIDEDDHGYPPCALGPQDVAVVMRAGLVEPHQGLQTQINNRILLELIQRQPPEFLLEVFVEMSDQVPRVLSGVLAGFLHQDQDLLLSQIDLAGFLEERLGLPVPRFRDYIAGGRRVRESYVSALSSLADAIFDKAEPYLVRRQRLRNVVRPRQAGPVPFTKNSPINDASARAIAAISTADRLAEQATTALRRDRAIAAYRSAFSACSDLLDIDPQAFTLPWFKSFWARNEEALKVLSIVRNHQEDIDDVRRWTKTLSVIKLGEGDVPRGEQALLERIVHLIYFYEKDRREVLTDPLVRLLIDPEPGKYAFTVVSAMGVITDGAEGRELEDAYRRLNEIRGATVVRVPTGLFRSLEYNAAAILKTLSGVKGPWGSIGYSQGCANILLAESHLRGGTPAQQKVADQLVCRNLLFSAANGSVHGTDGSRRLTAALSEGERFLKYYQARYSKEFINIALRSFRSVVDSKAFVHTVGGAHSLTLERAMQLHRDGQFTPWAATSTTIGAVKPYGVPESLEFMYHAHRRLLPGVANDTQVTIHDAVGHATRVRNHRTEVLHRCDIGSRVQDIHHWSPLSAEIDKIKTKRDEERAVYDSPKDRHVFPWVEVNARFGRIK